MLKGDYEVIAARGQREMGPYTMEVRGVRHQTKTLGTLTWDVNFIGNQYGQGRQRDEVAIHV